MQWKNLLALSVPVALACLSLLSCKDDITGNGPIDVVFPDSNVSYNGQVQPLFDRGCAFVEGCHAGDYPAAGLDLESYQQTLSSKPGVVIPGDTVHCPLLCRVEGTKCGQRMPLDRTPLNTNQIHGLARWVLEGARNN